jgi:hypothetical protein
MLNWLFRPKTKQEAVQQNYANPEHLKFVTSCLLREVRAEAEHDWAQYEYPHQEIEKKGAAQSFKYNIGNALNEILAFIDRDHAGLQLLFDENLCPVYRKQDLTSPYAILLLCANSGNSQVAKFIKTTLAPKLLADHKAKLAATQLQNKHNGMYQLFNTFDAHPQQANDCILLEDLDKSSCFWSIRTSSGTSLNDTALEYFSAIIQAADITNDTGTKNKVFDILISIISQNTYCYTTLSDHKSYLSFLAEHLDDKRLVFNIYNMENVESLSAFVDCLCEMYSQGNPQHYPNLLNFLVEIEPFLEMHKQNFADDCEIHIFDLTEWLDALPEDVAPRRLKQDFNNGLVRYCKLAH